jgi:gliding motility-associated-like protein
MDRIDPYQWAFLVAVVTMAGHDACAQPYWSAILGGDGQDEVRDVITDDAGSIYVVGEFRQSMTYEGQTLQSAGSTDAYVAKLDQSGAPIWMKRGGGNGLDRALAIDVRNGTVAVAGTYSSAADLFGTSLVAEGGTTDAFVAVLSAEDGSTIWVRGGGGGSGTDKALDVAISPDGGIVAVGEFIGSAEFAGEELTSMLDPFTNASSVDAWIARWNAAGDAQWARQGAAEHTDRATSVTCGAQNEVYVIGQFSDTITFQAEHPNASFSAVFFTRFSVSGQEEWFTRMAGSGFDRGHDIQYTTAGDLVVVGGMGGATVYHGAEDELLTSTANRAVLIMRIGTDGELAQWEALPSDDPAVAKSMDLRGDTLCVYGEFSCWFRGLADHYGGDGLFMATGDQDLFITRHLYSDLQLVDAQQYGGRDQKRCGGIASLPDGDLVFGGRFGHSLAFPADQVYQDEDLWGGWWSSFGYCDGNLNYQLATYCGDSAYGLFAVDHSCIPGQGFVARGFVRGRSPYDVWARNEADGCVRDRSEHIALGSPSHGISYTDHDTVVGCNWVELYPQPQAFGPSWNCACEEPFPSVTIGFEHQYSVPEGWEDFTMDVPYEGWVSYTAVSENGCWTWQTDSIYVIVTPPVIPLVSDDVVVNTDDLWPSGVTACAPYWTWASNVPPGYQVSWNDGLGTELSDDDSLFVPEGYIGDLYVVFTSPEGCTVSNSFYTTVSPPVLDLDQLTYDYTFWFQGEALDQDTLVGCGSSTCYSDTITMQWYLGGQPVQIPPPYWFSVPGTCPLSAWGGYPPGTFEYYAALTPGWTVFTYTGTLTGGGPPCSEADTLQVQFTDSLFYIPNDVPGASLIAPPYLCEGATGLIVLDCTDCDSIIWYGASIAGISAAADSAFIEGPGEYWVEASSLDGPVICDTAISVIIQGGDPFAYLMMEPSDGLLCPGSTAVLEPSVPGSGYVWTGPQGQLPETDATLVIVEQGEYTLNMLDEHGCALQLGPVSLNWVEPPDGEALPDEGLCPGEEVTLQLTVSGLGEVSWSPPLSGSSFSQTVSEGGLYNAVVEQCGNTDTLWFNIVMSDPQAELIDPGPFVICGDDPILLAAAPGPYDYFWPELGSAGPVAQVTAPGTYMLIVIDQYGCTDTVSATVEGIQFPEPLTVTDHQVCAGEEAVLQATGSGTIIWWSDDGSMDTLGTGSSWTIPSAIVTTTFLVTQQDGPCISEPISATVSVIALPEPPVLDGPWSICVGGSMVLQATAQPGSVLTWTFPGGSQQTGSSVSIGPATDGDGGTYTCTASQNGCNSLSVGEVLLVDTAASLFMDTVRACSGQAVWIYAPEGSTEVVWGDSTVAPGLPVTLPSGYTFTAVGPDGCAVLGLLQVVFEPCSLFVPNVFSPNGDGVNDELVPQMNGGRVVSMRIYNRWGTAIAEFGSGPVHWNGCVNGTGEPLPDGVYYYILLTDVGGAARTITGYVQLVR